MNVTTFIPRSVLLRSSVQAWKTLVVYLSRTLSIYTPVADKSRDDQYWLLALKLLHGKNCKQLLIFNLQTCILCLQIHFYRLPPRFPL